MGTGQTKWLGGSSRQEFGCPVRAGPDPTLGQGQGAARRDVHCGRGHAIWKQRDWPTSVSGLVIVLTLPVNEQEGHRPYLSQSAYPAKGTTVGGRTDDPRRERTRNALARHRARAGAWQRQRGLPRAGNLADGVLSLAHPAGTLRRRWGPSAAPAGRSGAAGGDPAGGGTAGARDRD